MPIATIKYDLSDFDDRQEFNRATQALNMAGAIWDIKNLMRQANKGIFSEPFDIDGNPCDKDAVAMEEVLPHTYHFNYDKFNEKFYEIMEERNIKIDELYS